MYSWGWNGLGMLGDGTIEQRVRPVPVPAAAGATSITAGFSSSCAGYADGTLRAWGWNCAGQLGDGTVVDRHTPVVVPSLRAAGPPAAQAYSVVVQS